ncbi:LysR family transcriptional regulator [Paraburkholderia sp. BCC1884]|uniref:LysR family transcriptional regulator n=1 Tax=Paraburkholderia sp. BCC1884 TaxID=2562668 RepID=UPI00118342D0|nr:LysR family transcriptional regulator [Paraburkholderia sp. BCC1884]
MDKFQAMTTFVAVAETGGLTAAARKLDVSPSVISRIISELEDHLGTRLLTRTTRIVRLTEAGTAFFDDCKRILTEVVEAELTAAGSHTRPQGHLSITAPVLFGKSYIMPIVAEYLERFPEVEIYSLFVDRVVNLVDEGVDIAVRIGELPDSSLQAVCIGGVRRILCAAPTYLEKYGIPTHPDQLADHLTVVASGISPSPEWRFLDNTKNTSVRLRPRLTTTTNDSAIEAAVAGVGITRLLSYQVASQLRDGTLRIVLADFEPPALPINIVHREGRHVTRKVRAFFDLAVDTLRSDDSLN